MRILSTVLVVVFLLSACGDRSDPSRPAREDAGASEDGLDFGNVQTVAGGLEVPWDLAFVDERTILVTERPGRVRVIADRRLRDEPAAEIDVRAEGEGGLLGIALHPDFSEERFAYLYYTAGDVNRVARYAVTDDLNLEDEEVILDDIPASANHNGGRIAFGPDGMLYVGTGDAGVPERAADRGSLAGKILRVAPDGSVPADNPFDRSPVFSFGHRNVQGMDWDAEGRMYASEHGPTGEGGLCCHDELNLIKAGASYGWPARAGRAPVAGREPSEDAVDPIVESGAEETWAPAGLVVDSTSDDPSLLVAALAGRALLRYGLERPDLASDPEVALRGHGRLRAAQFGPDDCLYVTTSNKDGRGDPEEDDDRILKLCA